jgi:CRP/FNR family transcriptional regulator, cyclic AMP receptor protein
VTVRGLFINAERTLQLDAGDRIFAAGDEGHLMYGVVTGQVALGKDGQELVRIGPDGTFGELAIIDHAPRSLDAVAVEPSTVAVIDERTFLYLVHETPMFALHVMGALAARIRELDTP